jgi:hypothetical protein
MSNTQMLNIQTLHILQHCTGENGETEVDLIECQKDVRRAINELYGSQEWDQLLLYIIVRREDGKIDKVLLLSSVDGEVQVHNDGFASVNMDPNSELYRKL